MLRNKKGLDDSIWASRGKSTNLYSSYSLDSPSRQSSSSAIIPAVPQPPSPTKNGHKSPDANSSKPPSTVVTTLPGTPTKPAPSTNGGAKSTSTAQREFKRYVQIVRRLKWKLPYLSHGYHHAIAKPGDPLYLGETNAQEAELMFKLDFYEYYMLLERALVHLLGVFGITVTKDMGEKCVPTPTAAALARGGGGGYSTHTFHQNVLATLQRPDNPLHRALGSGEVLFQLFRAKELRNRWKYAEETPAGKARRDETNGGARDGTAPLQSYDLDKIFSFVFQGFDEGYAVAVRRVSEETGAKARLSWADEVDGMEVEMEEDEDEFGFMVEAMDWEAV